MCPGPAVHPAQPGGPGVPAAAAPDLADLPQLPGAGPPLLAHHAAQPPHNRQEVPRVSAGLYMTYDSFV